MSEIVKKIQEIRDQINRARKQSLLLRERNFWNQLCSSLDMVEDTDLAIDEYLNIEEENKLGMNYLLVFGIMQTLYVQQDAIINMAESIGVKIELDSKLKSIREIRNNSIGHPTKRGRKLQSKYNYIVRAYLSHKNLSLMTVSPSEKDDTKFYHYNIVELITLQYKSVNKILGDFTKMLEDEDKAHKDKFKEIKLADTFPGTINYHFQKLTETSFGSNGKILGKGNFEIIQKSLEKFKEELQRRDSLDAYSGINMTFEDLVYPMKKLEDYFNDNIEMNMEEIRIYKFFIKSKFDELIYMAKEIDEDYEGKV